MDKDNEKHYIYNKAEKKFVSQHNNKKEAYKTLIDKHRFHKDLTVLHPSEFKIYGAQMKESLVGFGEFEQLDELSKDTLKNYIKQAAGSTKGSTSHAYMAAATNNVDTREKHIRKSFKRIDGINKAVEKLTKEEVELEERERSEYSANMALAGEKRKSGHYLKRGDEYVSNKAHDSMDSAVAAWNGLSDRKGVKIVKEEHEDVNEALEHEYVQSELAHKDINSKIENGKIVVHKDNLTKAKAHVKKLGHKMEVVSGLNEKCWDGYEQKGMKKKGDKTVPNCVKEESLEESDIEKLQNHVRNPYSIGASVGIHKPIEGHTTFKFATAAKRSEGKKKLIDAGFKSKNMSQSTTDKAFAHRHELTVHHTNLNEESLEEGNNFKHEGDVVNHLAKNGIFGVQQKDVDITHKGTRAIGTHRGLSSSKHYGSHFVVHEDGKVTTHPSYKDAAAALMKEDVETLDEMSGGMTALELHKHLKSKGWQLDRTGGGHDVFKHPKSKLNVAVPRHKGELARPTVKQILKKAEINEDGIASFKDFVQE